MGTNPVSMAQAPPLGCWAASRDVCYFLPPWPVFVPEAAAKPLSAGARRDGGGRRPREHRLRSLGRIRGFWGHSCPAGGFSAGPCSAPVSQLSSRAEPALFPRSPGSRFCASLQVRQPGIATALERLPAFQSEPGLLVFGLASSPLGPPPRGAAGFLRFLPHHSRDTGPDLWGCPLERPLCQQVLGTKRSVAMCRCHPSVCVSPRSPRRLNSLLPLQSQSCPGPWCPAERCTHCETNWE